MGGLSRIACCDDEGGGGVLERSLELYRFKTCLKLRLRLRLCCMVVGTVWSESEVAVVGNGMTSWWEEDGGGEAMDISKLPRVKRSSSIAAA